MLNKSRHLEDFIAHVVHSVKPVNASDKTFKPNSKMIFNVRLYCFDTGGGFILGFG